MLKRIRIGVTLVVVTMAAILAVAAIASSIPVQKTLAYSGTYSDPNQSTTGPNTGVKPGEISQSKYY